MTFPRIWAIAFGWLACLAGFSASALPATRDSVGLSVHTWQSDDGLPHNAIAGIAQTPDGYLWLGTAIGLATFDGARFESFPFTNSIFADNRQVKVMIGSRDGGLWVALERGAVVRLHGERTRVFTRADGLPDNQVHSLVEDADGTLWVLYIGGGRCRIQDNKVIAWPQDSRIVNWMTCDPEGRMWWARGGEAGIYRGGTAQPVFSNETPIERLSAAKSNGVWIVCGKHLVRCDAAGHARDCGEFTSGTPGSISAMVEDSLGDVWIGTSLAGLFRFHAGEFEAIPLSHAQVQSLLEDREGSLWVGTLGGGLSCIRPRVVQVQGVESGLPFEVVRSVAEDSKSNLWVTTDDGSLSRQTGGGWQVVAEKTFAHENLSSLVTDRDGGLWIGTRNRRLHRWRDGRLDTFEGLRYTTVFAMLVGSDGNVWSAGLSIVQRMDRDGGLKMIPLPGDVRTLRALAEDTAGTIWAGSARGGLFRAQGDQFVKVDLPETDPAKSIRCLTPLADGSLWIGCGGQGVERLKAGRYSRVGVEQGLSDGYISLLIADDYGWMWFGSDRGIFKVRQADLEAVMDGREKRVRPVRYGPAEGAPNLQANYGFCPGAIKASDGRIWMAMRSGVAVIDPRPARHDSVQPPVLLTRATVDGRVAAQYESVNYSDPGVASLNLQTNRGALTLPPNYRRLEIEFAAMSFIGLENIRFRYQLRGLERDWFEAGTERRATYSRLPAGDYVFEVRACNREGVWSETGPMLAITVLPYFWQTWWFLTFACVLLLGAVAGTVRYVSFRRLRRQLLVAQQRATLERERSRIAADLHDSLGADVTEIGLIAESVSLDALSSEAHKDRARVLSRRVRALAHSLDTVVWTVNPRNDSLDRLAGYLCDTFQELFRRSPVRTRLDVAQPIPAILLTPEERSNLFLVSKEAMNNILKHSGATEAWLRVRMDGEFCRIVIEDNGRGFDPAARENAERNGLTNMRRRLEEIGAIFQLNSAPGQGTRIEISIRVVIRDAEKATS